MAPSGECLRGYGPGGGWCDCLAPFVLAAYARAEPCCCCPAWQYRSCHCCPAWQAVVVIIVGWAVCLNLNKRRLLLDYQAELFSFWQLSSIWWKSIGSNIWYDYKVFGGTLSLTQSINQTIQTMANTAMMAYQQKASILAAQVPLAFVTVLCMICSTCDLWQHKLKAQHSDEWNSHVKSHRDKSLNTLHTTYEISRTPLVLFSRNSYLTPLCTTVPGVHNNYNGCTVLFTVAELLVHVSDT